MTDTRLLDKQWRIEHLYSIVDRSLQKRTFKRNRAQQHFERNRHNFNIILKSRRLGFTTYESIDILDDSLFTRNFSGLFIAHTDKDATEIFDKKIDFAWKNFDPELAKLWKEDANTSNKLKFDFGDKTFSSIIVSNSGRGGTNNRVHCSEYAKLCIKFPSKADEFITGTLPSIPYGGRCDIESTAEGMGGNFYEMFTEAEKRDRPPLPTEFKAHFYNWQWDDEEISKIETTIPVNLMEESSKFSAYQVLHNLSDIEITYYYTKWLSLQKDWSKLHQEFPTTWQEAFVASGTPYFNNEKIVSFIAKAPEPINTGEIKLEAYQPVFTAGDGKLKIWEYPAPDRSYIIGGDTSEGLENGDKQELVVIDNRTLKTVAEYNSTVSPDELAKIAYALGMWYNVAYLAVEANKDGLWVNTELFKMGYPNMYYREAIDDITHTVAKRLGFKTDASSRPVILAELQSLLNNLTECWNNRAMLEECLTFIRNSIGRPEAMSGKHDDRVMAYAIALAVRHNAPIGSITTPEIPQTNLEITKARLNKLYGNKSTNISQGNYI